MVENLVSLIIPCHNAARWLREAIDSGLAQSYRPLEIIVVDDGSTDDSLAIIRSYGDQVRHETGPQRGGNHARNRGYALSRGEYIQYLDADDYLLPHKIERQVNFLKETGAAAVYGDWRHQFHQPDGAVSLGEVVVSGAQNDVLEALLGGWWTANLSLLLRRQAVERAGGWDETLLAGQDRDFFIVVALSGADIRYQPGCDSVYRRYGNVTASTASRLRWLENQERILEKTEHRLLTREQLNDRYRRALAKSYFQLARNYYGIDRVRYASLMHKTLMLDPAFKPQESHWYNTTWRLLGFAAAERLAALKRRVTASV